jgi:hypothetical protein
LSQNRLQTVCTLGGLDEPPELAIAAHVATIEHHQALLW